MRKLNHAIRLTTRMRRSTYHMSAMKGMQKKKTRKLLEQVRSILKW